MGAVALTGTRPAVCDAVWVTTVGALVLLGALGAARARRGSPFLSVVAVPAVCIGLLALVQEPIQQMWGPSFFPVVPSVWVLVLSTVGAAAVAWRLGLDARTPSRRWLMSGWAWAGLVLGVGGIAVAHGGDYRKLLNTAFVHGDAAMPGVLDEPLLGAQLAYPADVVREPVSVVDMGSEGVWAVERYGRIVRLAAQSRAQKRARARGAREVDLAFGGETELEVVLDIREHVVTRVEQGLFSVAADPQLGPNRPYFYVTYVDESQRARLSRFDYDFTARALLPDTEVVLLDLEQQRELHNGGGLAFGADGYLYVGFGDDGRRESARDFTGVYAGVVRLDVSAACAAPPCVPDDNPFAGDARVPDALYALGLRNPYKLFFDPPTGELWVFEVGDGQWEEISRVHAGDHHQWPVLEGPRWAWRVSERPPGRWRAPELTYAHVGLRNCVIGGAVYHGQTHADLEGRVLFADHGSSEIVAWSPEQPDALMLVARLPPGSRATSVDVIDGEIYVSSMNGVFRLAAGAMAPAAPGDLYGALCSHCHGQTGTPTPAQVALFTDGGRNPPRNFHDAAWQERVSDDHISTVIRHGGKAAGLSSGMPAWGEALTDDQVSALVKRVRGFGHED